MSKLHCDKKCMYKASTSHRFISVVPDEIKNYFVTVPLYRETLHEVGEALLN